MAAKEGCEVVIYGIQAIFDAHFDQVVFEVNIANTFNTILHKVLGHLLGALGNGR